MKTTVFFACVFCVVLLKSQTEINIPVCEKTGNVFYEKVIQVPDKSKDLIYIKIKQWIPLQFRTAKDVIEADDKNNGVIVLKGASDVTIETGFGNVVRAMFFTISVYIRDERFKIEVSNIYYENYPDKSNNFKTDRTSAEEMMLSKKMHNNKGEPRRVNISYRENTNRIVNYILTNIEEFTNEKNSFESDW
jgi:hypothetical protein